MQTEQRTKTEWTGESRRRRMIPVLAGAAAVIAAIVVAVVLVSGGSEEVASPLEVGEALNQAAIAGDWASVLALYASDAIYSDVCDSVPQTDAAGRPFQYTCLPPDANVGVLGQPARPANTGYPNSGLADWNGDGVNSIGDIIVSSIMFNYAAGVTTFHACELADEDTLVCERVRDGAAFGSPIGQTSTYTVVDGAITGEAFEEFLYDDEPDPFPAYLALTWEYQDWVRDNRPELNRDDSLFELRGKLRLDPETVETHRQLIQEWQAQR